MHCISFFGSLLADSQQCAAIGRPVLRFAFPRPGIPDHVALVVVAMRLVRDLDQVPEVPCDVGFPSLRPASLSTKC